METKKMDIEAKVSDFDKLVGRRLYTLRSELGFSQLAVATLAGLTPQQISNYEKGECRLTAGMCCHLAQKMKVPVGTFFPSDGEVVKTEKIGKREMSLIHMFWKINIKERHKVLDIVKILSGAGLVTVNDDRQAQFKGF